MSHSLKEFIKKNVLFALDAPKRNLLGDVCVGWHRSAQSPTEKVTMEQAELFLEQDIQKAKKAANRLYQMGNNEVVVFILFYVGNKRWKEVSGLLGNYRDIVNQRDRVKLAIEITNHRYFQNSPSLAVYLAKKVLTGETSL